MDEKGKMKIDGPLVIAGRSFGSRLLLGTGKFPSSREMIRDGDAIEIIRPVGGG